MTRKHFKEIARILGENNASITMIREFMDFCMKQNDNFDRPTFLDAIKTAHNKRSIIPFDEIRWVEELGNE
tara:strand:+ start:53 stop:265 length:213 start_codon:yes stop_codon:yes gene_type:complete